MKPLPLFLSIFFLCALFAILLPQLARLQIGKFDHLPITSATAIAPAVEVLRPSPGVLVGAPMDAQVFTGDFIAAYPGINEFAARLINGRADEVVGVYARDLFALPVSQQPSGEPDFVDRDNGVLTQFSLPKKYGATGLLAHNYLSGDQFYQLRKNEDVVLIYGDGRLEHYRIKRIESFQALKPNSPFSDFVNLSDPNGGTLSSADLFSRVYTTRHQLVFQTCIEAEGEPSWGRMFVIASLAEPLQLSVPDSFATSNN